MSSTFTLFETPKEILSENGVSKILIASEFALSLSESGKILLYSISSKNLIFSEEGVSSASWIETTIFKTPLLALTKGDTVSVFSFDKNIPDNTPFDEAATSYSFSPRVISENVTEITNFTISSEKCQLLPSGLNSIIILDADGMINTFTVFPDGIYRSKQVSAEGCKSFSYNGEVIAGISETNIHSWDTNMNHLGQAEIQGKNICPISNSKFAVISENTAVLFDNQCKETEKVNTTQESAEYIAVLQDGSVFSLPKGFKVCGSSHFLPLFVTEDNSSIVTIGDNVYIQRILDVFPLSIAIPILSARSGEDDSADFLARTAIETRNIGLCESFLKSQDAEHALSFLQSIVKKLKERPNSRFISAAFAPISQFCISQIKQNNAGFGDFLVEFRSLLGPSVGPLQTIPKELPSQNVRRIRKEELVSYVLEALKRNAVTAALPTLKKSFPDFASPFDLFRTIVLQQVWTHVCAGQLQDASRLIEELGEVPAEHFREMWRQTTRNKTRQVLYEYLHKQGILSEQDEKNHQILLKITTKYPNTSFQSAQRLSSSPALRTVVDDAKLPPWKPIVDLTADFNENANMVFAELFKIPPEPNVESPRYFVGNIALIEAQSPRTIKMLTSEGNSVERLWILHCEHRVNDMANLFKAEIEKARGITPTPKLKCLKFINTYHAQMNVYELETLLDILCQNGFFAEFELEDFELLLVRICKNKFLFDQQWWTQTQLDFAAFFKKFGAFCAKKSLFMPFEMFVISHPKAKEVDLSDLQEPLIRFIWDLWVKRDPAAATLSCMQFIAKSNSTDQIELWKSLPNESLAPLASFVWNKDPEKFKPGSPETEALSERLKSEYPLLSSLVKGEIPHPSGPEKEKPESKWRSPIFTSKYDLELHDLIASHFNYDFSKVFTDYYGQTPGQPNYPHFDHPELIAAPSEPPYVHYVKSMLPVSAFQQAVDDGVDEQKFKELCHQCMMEALADTEVRLAALTFIELVDIKFGSDSATDYKLALAVYDKLSTMPGTSETVNDISMIFSTHNQQAAVRLQKKLQPNDIELFLISALLGVRCGLPLDYTPIITFSRRPRPAELLLFIDRAAELGAHYPISEVVKIVQDEMPESKDNPLKDHLLFHLTQSLPAEEGPSCAEVPPALVVFRAVRKAGPLQQHAALLQEALNRKAQLYALLATSVDGADNMLCALVTLMTMVDAPPPLDVQNPPPHEELIKMFTQLLVRLMQGKKSLEVMQSLELFSEKSVAVTLVQFYRSVELFSFRRSEKVLPSLREILQAEGNIEDDLLGTIPVSVIKETFFQMLDALMRQCAARSQLHVFRFLQILDGCPVSEFLAPRVKLCHKISTFDNFRRAVVHCDLLGSPDQVVSDLVLNHSLALGQAAAECLGTSSEAATKQWLTFQYSTAATPAQVLEIHRQIVSDLGDTDKMFFVSLYASLLPYAQPTAVKELIKYAKTLFTDDSKLSNHISALLVLLDICEEQHIEVSGPPGAPPTLQELLHVLFPKIDMSDAPDNVRLGIASPLLFGLETIQHFFDTAVDRAIDVCLDTRRIPEARLLCEWRDRDPGNIELLETVQKAVSGDTLTDIEKGLLTNYGDPNGDLEELLDSIAEQKKWRFLLIALHYKAAKRLNLQTENVLKKRSSDFVSSELSVTFDQWDLVRQLIEASHMSSQESATCLANSYTEHVKKLINAEGTPEGVLAISDYGENFTNFTKLCDIPSSVGESLFSIAQNLPDDSPIAVKVNLLLHSSLCTPDIDECAEKLDALLDTLTSNNDLTLVKEIISVFPDPALLPRFFQYLIVQQKIDDLPHEKLSDKVGRVIMNCARHVQPFEPQNYFKLTMQYSLFRDHAELQMECGSRLLQEPTDKTKLQEASRHYLLALAYFLHEKCYSLSMECLKKLSLISLQLEVPEPCILHLNKQQVLQLMCTKDFPFALTIAVAFDMDTEQNWAEALFSQSVLNKGEEFLTAFQYFRPITSNLCAGVVSKYKSLTPDDAQRDRMKSFLLNIPNLVERYRISKALDFQDQIESMKEVNPVVCEWCERVLTSKQ